MDTISGKAVPSCLASRPLLSPEISNDVCYLSNSRSVRGAFGNC
jgi:hypothetical protein